MNTRRISLRSLFFYLIRRFWVILLFAVCFGVLLAGYKYLKDRKEADTSVVNDGSNLTDDEKMSAENAFLQYQNMKVAEKYLAESELMKCDTKSEVQYLVEYRIQKKGLVDGLSTGTLENTYQQLIRAYINDGLYIPELAKIKEEYGQYPYIKELIWCNNTSLGEITVGVVENARFPELSDDVRKVVDAYIAELQSGEQLLSVEVMKADRVTVYDGTTETAQRTAISNVINLRKAYMNAYYGFTASQNAYLKYLIDGSGKKKVTNAAPKGISKRYAVVGIAVGAVLGVCFLLLMLYLSLKHASPADYTENAGLRSFGLAFVAGKKKNRLLKKEYKNSLFDTNDDSIDYAVVRITAYCRNHRITELSLLSSRSDRVIEDAADALRSRLSKQGIKVLSTEKVATDSKALSELITSRYGLFIEKLQGGNRKKLRELIQFCNENEVEVIGSLGVAELKL